MFPDRFQWFPQIELWLYVVTMGKLMVAELFIDIVCEFVLQLSSCG
jgi:hypothetical protein